MALATGTLTFALADLLGAIGESIDPTRVKVWIESNLPDGAVIDTTGNVIRVGNPTADVSAAGSGSFVGLPLTTFVTGMQYRVTVEYPDAGTSSRKIWSSGWFDFTAAGDLADQDMQATAAPITWQTAFTDAMEAIADEARAYRDQAHDISGIATPDSLVAALVSATSGSATTAVLAALYADKAATTSALAGKIAAALIGAANGVTPLGSDQKVPASYLPSYVDDVLEYANLAAFPTTGETGKIYVADATGKIYRWSGSAYIEISPSPGSTDSVTEGATNLYFTNARAQAALALLKGIANGYASLGADGKLTAAQAPSSTTAPLVRVAYNPASATSASASSAIGDPSAANLVITFTTPASGSIRVALEGLAACSGSNNVYTWLLREGGTNVPGSGRPALSSGTSPLTARVRTEISITGLTPGSSHTYKWSHVTSSTASLNFGGTEFSASGTYGPAIMEVYAE